MTPSEEGSIVSATPPRAAVQPGNQNDLIRTVPPVVVSTGGEYNRGAVFTR